MRGYIKKRYKNSYTIVINFGIDPVAGKRKQQWISVKGSKKDAEKKLAELLHQLDTGTYMKPGKTKLAEFLEIWLHDYIWPNLAPRTAEGYEQIVRKHLIPGLGSITMTLLKPEQLQMFYSNKLANGRLDGKGALSIRTVRYIHTTIHAALKQAVKLGLLHRNVADLAELPRNKRAEMHVLNEEDISRILDAAKETEYYTLFYLACFTGMRRSELLALRWSDIDLIYCQISVTRTLHHLRDGRIIYGDPKTEKGRRLISLSPSTMIVLRNYREQRVINYQLLDRILKEDNLVFSQPDGSPLLPDTVTHAWVRLTRSQGYKDIRFHDIRHTHASLLLKQNIHPKIVQERLGHASIGITLNIYSHVVPGLQEAAAKRFDELFTKKKETEIINKIG
jgi:integrase